VIAMLELLEPLQRPHHGVLNQVLGVGQVSRPTR
jgi:hypothetical protein